MSKPAGGILAGVGQELEFTNEDLSHLAPFVRDKLIGAELLEPYHSLEWYCESCEEYHSIDTINNTLYQVCPNDYTASYSSVNNEQTKRWRFNWNKLKQQIRSANILAYFDLHDSTKSLMGIGSSSQYLVLMGHFSTSVLTLIQVVEELSQSYKERQIILITTQAFILNSRDQSRLEALRVQIINFDSLLSNNWVLPLDSPQEDYEAKLTLNVASKTVTLNTENYWFPSGKKYLFRTLQIIASAQGSIVSQVKFEEQYHQSTSKNNATSIDMSGYINKANTLLKEAFPVDLREVNLIENVYGEGYKLNPDFVPAKILP